MAGKPACLVVMLLAGMLAGLSSAAPEGRDDEAARAVVAAPDVAAAVAELTNAERTRAGLAALRASLRLVQAAQIHAEQMARLRRLDHVLRDGDHPRPEDRLAAVAYRWQAWAENVASGQRTAAEVVAGWMRSPGHRANIMSSSVTEVGAGYARDANGRPYWVQVFGRPLS